MTINPIVILVVVVLTLAILVGGYLRKKKRSSPHYRMAAILKPRVRDEISHVIIPDGIGGLMELEHLILLDQGILLIETYAMAGHLFGADKIDQWTQLIEGRSYKFANPLRHIRSSRQAIKTIAPNIPIFCRIVFTADSTFPKGKPDEVSTLKTLDNDLRFIDNEPKIKNKALLGWERVMRIARKDGQSIQRDGGFHG